MLEQRVVEVPVEVCNEIIQFANNDLEKLIDVEVTQCLELSEFVGKITQMLRNTFPALLLRMPKTFIENHNIEVFRKFTVLLSRGMGELIVQNAEGSRLVTVYDRDPNRTMADGARYHQTHEGGSIHTDNVNIPEPWEYLILSCLAQAPVGGENIIVNGDDVVEQIAKNFPKALKILESNFYWEKRGVSDELYQAPIITYDNEGHALFRHLRPYMESAHRRARLPMSSLQVQAVDILDAYLNFSKLQSRFLMQPFECLVSIDSRTLHGRTCFADHENSFDITKWDLAASSPKRRTMDRLWVRRHQ